MADPRAVALGSTARHTGQSAGHRTALALTLLFVLAAVSAGLVVYTAWRHDLESGLFAIAFTVLSARAALSWVLWSSQPVNSSAGQQDRGDRKPADETVR